MKKSIEFLRLIKEHVESNENDSLLFLQIKQDESISACSGDFKAIYELLSSNEINETNNKIKSIILNTAYAICKKDKKIRDKFINGLKSW